MTKTIKIISSIIIFSILSTASASNTNSSNEFDKGQPNNLINNSQDENIEKRKTSMNVTKHKEELDKLKKIAQENPTPENMKNYLDKGNELIIATLPEQNSKK